MRTTLTLDDDVATKLRQLAHRRRIPFKDVVNAVLRRGLSAAGRVSDEVKAYRVETFRSTLRAGIDPMRLNQLPDELDAEEFVTQSVPRREHGPA